jgi:hypothetical protein
MRLAGEVFELDLNEGVSDASIEGLRRGFRRDKMIPRSLMSGFNTVEPENSQPGFSMTGSYQPSVAYGL